MISLDRKVLMKSINHSDFQQTVYLSTNWKLLNCYKQYKSIKFAVFNIKFYIDIGQQT